MILAALYGGHSSAPPEAEIRHEGKREKNAVDRGNFRDRHCNHRLQEGRRQRQRRPDFRQQRRDEQFRRAEWNTRHKRRCEERKRRGSRECALAGDERSAGGEHA